METVIFRILLLIMLFFLLTGDYTTFFSHILQRGTAPTHRDASRTTSKSYDEDADPTQIEEALELHCESMWEALMCWARHIQFSDCRLLFRAKEDIRSPDATPSSWPQLMSTIKNSCLPKLICELNASPHKEKLTDSEKSLLSLIRDTSLSVTAEVTSKYHFAAHMGQLIAGVDGAGCHNFYPACPFPGLQVMHMMKKVKIR